MRDYVPLTGRYLEVDPAGLFGGISKYDYVGGNPLLYIDKTGSFGTIIVGAVGGFMFDVAWQVARDPFGPIDWGEVLVSTLGGGLLGLAPALGAAGLSGLTLGGAETIIQSSGAGAIGGLSGLFGGAAVGMCKANP